MAVLRAARLWILGLPPGSFAEDEIPPAVDPSLPSPKTVMSYRVPAGKIAIVRTITGVMTGTINPNSSPSFFVSVRPVGGGVHFVMWLPFGTFGSSVNTWKPTAQFDGTLTLNALDEIHLGHNWTQDVVSTGSGMEMFRET